MLNDATSKVAASLETASNLAARGVDISESHEVEHFFLGSTEKITKLERSLIDAGYSIDDAFELKLEDSELEEEPMFGLLVSHALDEDTLRNVITACCRAADLANIEYDGWDVDVSRWGLEATPNEEGE